MNAFFFVLLLLITVATIFVLCIVFFSKGPETIEGVAMELKEDMELYHSPLSDLDPMPTETFYIKRPIYLLKIKSGVGNIFYFKMTREDYEKLKQKKMVGKKIKILFSRDLTDLYLKEWYEI